MTVVKKKISYSMISPILKWGLTTKSKLEIVERALKPFEDTSATLLGKSIHNVVQGLINERHVSDLELVSPSQYGYASWASKGAKEVKEQLEEHQQPVPNSVKEIEQEVLNSEMVRLALSAFKGLLDPEGKRRAQTELHVGNDKAHGFIDACMYKLGDTKAILADIKTTSKFEDAFKYGIKDYVNQLSMYCELWDAVDKDVQMDVYVLILETVAPFRAALVQVPATRAIGRELLESDAARWCLENVVGKTRDSLSVLRDQLGTTVAEAARVQRAKVEARLNDFNFDLQEYYEIFNVPEWNRLKDNKIKESEIV